MTGEKVEADIGSATAIGPAATMTGVAMTTEVLVVMTTVTVAGSEMMIVIGVVEMISTEVGMTEVDRTCCTFILHAVRVCMYCRY